jgi:hypothetical protein
MDSREELKKRKTLEKQSLSEAEEYKRQKIEKVETQNLPKDFFNRKEKTTNNSNTSAAVIQKMPTRITKTIDQEMQLFESEISAIDPDAITVDEEYAYDNKNVDKESGSERDEDAINYEFNKKQSKLKQKLENLKRKRENLEAITIMKPKNHHQHHTAKIIKPFASDSSE